MVELLFLMLSLFLSGSNVTGAWESTQPPLNTLQDMHRKVNDLWLSLLYPLLYEEITTANRTGYACCSVKPSSKLESDKPQVTGFVLFRQAFRHDKLEVVINLAGFPTGADSQGRAIHIHQYGDLSNGCDSTGGHYNPLKVNHPRHPGDFGNFYSRDGKVRKVKTSFSASLFGPYTVLGRSVVIHEQEDDLGKGGNQASLENGNAGKRLACCVIGTCSRSLWDRHFPEIAAKRKKRVVKPALGQPGISENQRRGHLLATVFATPELVTKP